MMFCYRHVQVGWFLIGSFLAIEALFFFMSNLVAAILASLIVIFGWLTVEVDDEKVSCSFEYCRHIEKTREDYNNGCN